MITYSGAPKKKKKCGPPEKKTKKSPDTHVKHLPGPVHTYIIHSTLVSHTPSALIIIRKYHFQFVFLVEIKVSQKYVSPPNDAGGCETLCMF